MSLFHTHFRLVAMTVKKIGYQIIGAMAITHMNCKATVAALARIMHYQFAAITLEDLVRNMTHLNAERRSIEQFCRTQHLQLLECERGCCAHSTYEKVVPIIFGFESYCLRLHLSDDG